MTAVATKPKHPAAFTPAIVDLMVERLEGIRGTIIDPFAGLGLYLPRFVGPGRKVIGYEIEQPWVDAGGAATAGLMRQGDSTKLPHRTGTVAGIFTSPTYGGRFADSHKARERCSVCEGTGQCWDPTVDGNVVACLKCDGTGTRNHTRRGYTHDIRAMTGNPDYELAANNSGRMHYGREYQALHRAVYRELWRVARPATEKREGCRFVLNVSDFYRDRKRVNSAVWHLATCVEIGWEWKWAKLVPTPRMKYGANADLRAEGEWVYEFTKPAPR